MPFQITFENPPISYATSSGKPGEKVKIQVVEFTSTDDGVHFIRRLEELPKQILQMIHKDVKILPSQVDHMLVIVRPGGQATVYINELVINTRIRAAKTLPAGSIVRKDDIAEIDRIDLGVEIPEDCGVLFLVSVGWRKGLFYDFGPVAKKSQKRSFDILQTLGSLYGYLLFQERFRLDDDQWERILQSGWFLFIGMGTDLIQAMIGHVQANFDLDELTDQIAEKLSGDLDRILESWAKNVVFKEHILLLQKAVKHFKNGDYESTVAIAVPRIEGLLRTYFKLTGPGGKPSDNKLVKTALTNAPESSVVIPNKFKGFLNKVYFKSHNPSEGLANVASRHSVGHGTAHPDAFNKKAAAISLLTLHQLAYAFRPLKKSSKTE